MVLIEKKYIRLVDQRHRLVPERYSPVGLLAELAIKIGCLAKLEEGILQERNGSVLHLVSSDIHSSSQDCTSLAHDHLVQGARPVDCVPLKSRRSTYLWPS